MAAGLEIKVTCLIVWRPTHLQNVSDVKRRFKCRLANQGNISNLRPFLIVSKTFDGFSSASSRLLFLILADTGHDTSNDATTNNNSYLSIIIKKSGKKRAWDRSSSQSMKKKKFRSWNFRLIHDVCSFQYSLKDLEALDFDWAHTYMYQYAINENQSSSFQCFFFHKKNPPGFT